MDVGTTDCLTRFLKALLDELLSWKHPILHVYIKLLPHCNLKQIEKMDRKSILWGLVETELGQGDEDVGEHVGEDECVHYPGTRASTDVVHDKSGPPC